MNVALCALNKVFGQEPELARRLISMTGSPEGVFAASGRSLQGMLGPFSKYSNSLTSKLLDDTATELERLAGRGCRFVGMDEPGYPELLRECPDAPVGLYVRCASEASGVPSDRPLVAVVGTRDISPYGRQWCRAIVSAMADCPRPPTIVSGLALGTDIIAHTTALERGIPTIAVLPTGIDDIYPSSHRQHAALIAAAQDSALVTDYPPGTVPVAWNFLRRNRIIAGMSQACILIESKRKGGGMMTARLAFGYDRDVFALPGRVDDLRSQGCIQLIREKVAEAIEDPQSLILALGLDGGRRHRRSALEETLTSLYGTPENERSALLTAIALHVRENAGCTPEDIVRALGLRIGEVLGALSTLECDRVLSCDLLQRYSLRGC